MGGSDYERITLREAGLLVGNFAIGVQRIEAAAGDIVHLTFESANPSDNLGLKAKTVELEYEAKGGELELSRVILTGNVFVQHPDGTVMADAGVIEIVKARAVFTGNCTLDSENSGSATGEKAEFDFETRDFSILGRPTASFSLASRRKGGELAPYLLAEDDVTDWKSFLETLQTQAKSDAPSPGRRLVALLPDDYARLIRESPLDNLLRGRDKILELLNENVQNPEFNEPKAWNGIKLDPPVKAMLESDSVPDPISIVWLNRSLLHAAYPAFLTPPPALEPPEGEN
jgi:hypothetical protein